MDTACPVCDVMLSISREGEEEEDQRNKLDATFWAQSPEEVAFASKASFDSLPSSVQVVSAAERRKAKRALYNNNKKCRGNFAVPPRHLAGRFIGNIQPQRTTAFFRAVSEGFEARVRVCIEQGCDVEAVNEYGNTALLMATWQCRADIVSLLLRSGANYWHTNHTGKVQ